MKHFCFYFLLGLVLQLSAATAMQAQENQRVKLCEEALENEEYDECRQCLSEELAENPKNSEAWLLLSKMYFGSLELDSTKMAAEKGLKYTSKKDSALRVSLYEMLAYAELGSDNQENALKIANKAIKEYPQLALAYSMRARVYDVLEMEDEAIADCKMAIKLNPNDATDDMLSLLQYAWQARDFETVQSYAEQILAKDSINDVAYTALSACYFLNQQQEKAIDMCLDHLDLPSSVKMLFAYADTTATLVNERLLARHTAEPNNVYYLRMLAALNSNAGQQAEAIGWLKKLLTVEPKSSYASSIAALYTGERKFDEAVPFMEQALILAKDTLESKNTALQVKAVWYAYQGMYDKTIGVLDTLVNDNPEDMNLFYKRAFIRLLKGGEDEKVLSELNQIIEQHPYGEECAYFWKGWLCLKKGRIDEANGAFRYAIENEDEDNPTYCTFLSQHFLGIDQTAKATLQTILDTPEQQKEAYLYAAAFYALLGDKPMAVRYLELAIEKGCDDFYEIMNHPLLQSLKGYADYDNLLKKHLPNP